MMSWAYRWWGSGAESSARGDAKCIKKCVGTGSRKEVTDESINTIRTLLNEDRTLLNEVRTLLNEDRTLLNEDRNLTLQELEPIMNNDLGEPLSRMSIFRDKFGHAFLPI